jgi:hypothetical protein
MQPFHQEQEKNSLRERLEMLADVPAQGKTVYEIVLSVGNPRGEDIYIYIYTNR